MNPRLLVGVLLCVFLVSCNDGPVAPPPPTIAEQIAAWNPRIIVDEPLTGFNPSLEIYTVTRGDTITSRSARFRFDSSQIPDSVVWTFGAGTYTTLRTTITKIPVGLHSVQALTWKRFVSVQEGKDTTVERAIERTFVSLDYSHSLAIGKWVPVDPKEARIDTLRVLYQEIIPGIQDTFRRNYVLGVTRGCDTAAWNRKLMSMALRRYALNFERDAVGGNCQWAIGELVLSSTNQGMYRFRHSSRDRIDTVSVVRVP